MKIAFLSDADSPGPFRHKPRDWNVNSVEGIARALGANVWHGTEVFDAFIPELQQQDFVICNMKHSLWKSVPKLASIVGREKLIGYQEGPADLLGRLRADKAEDYLAAHRLPGRVLVYDRRAIAVFQSICLNKMVTWLPIPAQFSVYSAVRAVRGCGGMLRVAVHSTLDEGRGTALSSQLVGKYPCEIVLNVRSLAECIGAGKMLYRQTQKPDIWGWQDWNTGGWLPRLASCDIGVNMDNQPCYGRFVVDCAGVGIPCVGSDQTFIQGELFPDLTFSIPSEWDRAQRALARMATDAAARARIVEKAQAKLRRNYTDRAVRKLFEEATGQCLDS